MELMIDVVMLGLVLSIGLCVIRLIAGPTPIDRVLALDTIATNVVALLVVSSMDQTSRLYSDAALVIAVLGYLSTVALTNFVSGGHVFELRDDR